MHKWVERQSTRRRALKTTTKMKVLRVMRLLQCVSPGASAWREQMSAINTRIHQFSGNKTGERQNVFISKTWHFWTASSSGLYVGPEWLTETLTSDFLSCETWLHLRLWDIDWWWQIFRITKHMNEQVCNENICFAKRTTRKHTETSIWHASTF